MQQHQGLTKRSILLRIAVWTRLILNVQGGGARMAQGEAEVLHGVILPLSANGAAGVISLYCTSEKGGFAKKVLCHKHRIRNHRCQIRCPFIKAIALHCTSGSPTSRGGGGGGALFCTIAHARSRLIRMDLDPQLCFGGSRVWGTIVIVALVRALSDAKPGPNGALGWGGGG